MSESAGRTRSSRSRGSVRSSEAVRRVRELERTLMEERRARLSAETTLRFLREAKEGRREAIAARVRAESRARAASSVVRKLLGRDAEEAIRRAEVTHEGGYPSRTDTRPAPSDALSVSFLDFLGEAEPDHAVLGRTSRTRYAMDHSGKVRF
eukprot:Hpha_TRINITY_DN27503_c0_g1::TRINITY_DN27503_c0_g1_i1::g.86155::m.86155